MSDNGFKDYIEKRTVEQVMEDYSEQHDEWRESCVSHDGDKKIFHLANGNSFEIEVCAKGSMDMKPEIGIYLRHTSPENQLERFFITENKELFEASCAGPISYEQFQKDSVCVSRYKNARKIFFCDGVFAGAAVDTSDGIGILQPDHSLRISSDPEKHLYMCFWRF